MGVGHSGWAKRGEGVDLETCSDNAESSILTKCVGVDLTVVVFFLER